jgi:hypothetical protein
LQDGNFYGAIHGPVLIDNKVDWISGQLKWRLSNKKLQEYYQDPYYVVGKRFNSKTSYLMLDIDIGSSFHPDNNETKWRYLLFVLEAIGLVRPIIVRSSDSGGLHLYFVLAKPVLTWKAAKKLANYLRAKGCCPRSGELELFPNPKAKESQYNGHRLPLQAGSYLLNDDLQVVSDRQQAFVNAWETSKAGNCLDFQAPDRSRWGGDDTQLPPIAWTGPGQSNEILKQLANYGFERLNLRTIPELARWIETVAPKLPGYDTFASTKTRQDIAQGWCYRWARSRIRRSGKPNKKQSTNLNQQRAGQATYRLQYVLKDLGKKLWQSANALYKAVCQAILEAFGVVIGKGTFQARKSLWEPLLKSSATHDRQRPPAEDSNHQQSQAPEVIEQGGISGKDKNRAPEVSSAPISSDRHAAASLNRLITVENANCPDKPAIARFEGCPDDFIKQVQLSLKILPGSMLSKKEPLTQGPGASTDSL